MPDAASGIGPVRSFGSVAEYGLTAEQTPLETPSQFTGMIESEAPFNVHSTVSSLEIVTLGGEKEPSGFTFTVTVPADNNEDIAQERIAATRL
jgi:predicted ABC-type ATPase